MIRIYEQADQLDVDAWESIQSDADVALSHAGIRLAEQTAGVSMRYIVAVAEDGTWVGGLPVAVATSEARWVLGRPDALLERAVSNGEPGADKALALVGGTAASLLPTLLIGGRHMGNSTMLLAEEAPAETPARLLRAASDLADRFGARSTSAAFIADSNERFAAALREAGYSPFGVSRSSSLALAPGGFGAWLGAFPKKNDGRSAMNVDGSQKRGSVPGLCRCATSISTDSADSKPNFCRSMATFGKPTLRPDV